MDTRQLAAFCAVVERRSFSQAADQLGVTQPAVSLQIRSLEQRLGQQLLDRSGRRVEPTEAGLRLYRGAQRLLALEQQVLAELGEEAEGELKGRLEIGASTGPGGSVLPVVLGEFQQLNPQVHVALTVGDTHTVVEQVGRRELELGVVGVASRQRGVSFEPLYRDEVVLAVPSGHKRAGKSMSLDELKAEPLVLMQEGAGIRQMIDLNVKLELGLQESARAAVLAGVGATFISRIAIEGDLDAGALAVARVQGLEPSRDVQLVRASGRAETRVAQEFVAFARERLS
jgi:DNA-binding transcriptional LysR family regulator